MNERRFSPMEDNHDGAFTVDGFCRKYCIGRTAFYEEVTAGRLKAKKRGTRTMIERAEARQWFANLPASKRELRAPQHSKQTTPPVARSFP